jgi:hypothetical protein
LFLPRFSSPLAGGPSRRTGEAHGGRTIPFRISTTMGSTNRSGPSVSLSWHTLRAEGSHEEEYLSCACSRDLLSCEQAEFATISAITSNWDSYKDRGVQIEGVRVTRNSGVISVSSRLLDYIAIEDESGRMNVWYSTVQRRCPPRMGATVTVDGNVVDMQTTDAETGETGTRQAFVAGSFSIENEPPLGDGEVRVCQLSLEEQQMLAMKGPEALEDY